MRVLALLALLGVAYADTSSPVRFDPPAVPDRAVAVQADAAARVGDRGIPQAVLRWAGGYFVPVAQTQGGVGVVGARWTERYDVAGRWQETVGGPAAQAPTPGDVDAGIAALWAAQATDGDGVEVTSVRPLVLAQPDGARPVWAVDVRTREPLQHLRVYVDRVDGVLRAEEPLLFTAQAEVYPTNPDASELVEVQLPVTADELRNGYTWVRSCNDFDSNRWQCDGKERQAAPDANGDYFYAPAPLATPDPFAELQMFWHVDTVARFFDDQFGFHTDFGIGGTALEAIVNFDLQNAFFGEADGDGIPEIAFGQGGGVDFAYDGDVVYHEYGHAVFGQVVSSDQGRYDHYGRVIGPGGLNEGTADLFSMTISQDPVLGEYAGGGPLQPGYIRDLDADRRCPDDLYGQSHRDGETWAALGWNLIEDESIGAELTAHLVFGTLNAWDDEVSFGAAGLALLGVADDLRDQAVITAEQRERIGVIVAEAGFEDCGRAVRLDEGQEPTMALSGRRSQDGTVRVTPLPNQISLDAPAGTQALRFYVDDLVGDSDMGWTAWIRRGDLVWFELDESSGNFPRPVATEFDFVVEGQGPGLIVELTTDSDPPVGEGETWYVALSGRAVSGNRQSADVTLRGERDWDEPVVATPGADDDDVGQGCQCQGQGSAAFLPLLLVVAPLRRRRA